MKKHLRFIVTMICVLAMCVSLCSVVMAAEANSDVNIETVYKMAQKALDQQAIQNVMSRHVMYHCYGLHQEEMEQIWVQEPENQATASFGQNQGFYVGYEAIWDAYVDGHSEDWLKTAKSYLDKQGIDYSAMSDDEILAEYGGVGQLLLHVTTTAIIEVAEDGMTAKCFWYSPGMICETGQSGNTIWEAYGVDFVKEGDEWKMWHLHMFTDFMGSFYLTLGGNSGGSGGGQGAGGAAPEGESAGGESAGGEQPSPAEVTVTFSTGETATATVGEPFEFFFQCDAPGDMGAPADGEEGAGITVSDGVVSYSNVGLGGPNSYPTSEKVTVTDFSGDFTVEVCADATNMDATHTIYFSAEDIEAAIASAEAMAAQMAENPMDDGGSEGGEGESEGGEGESAAEEAPADDEQQAWEGEGGAQI